MVGFLDRNDVTLNLDRVMSAAEESRWGARFKTANGQIRLDLSGQDFSGVERLRGLLPCPLAGKCIRSLRLPNLFDFAPSRFV